MAVRYQKIARHIISCSHTVLSSGHAFALTEILEILDVEEHVEQVLLPDSDSERIRRLGMLAAAIRTEQYKYERRRLTCPISESAMAPGSYIYVHSDSKEIDSMEREYRARLRVTPSILDLLRSLHPIDFEVLCGTLLKRLGCKNVTVTVSKGDDGVDGVAELPLVDRAVTPVRDMTAMQRLVADLSFLVYLQAKRYREDHPVEKSEVHELVGSWSTTVNEFGDGTLANDRRAALVAADYRVADPVLMIFATTSYFRAGAQSRGEAAGVVLLDGEQLAHLMAILGLGIEASGAYSYKTSSRSVSEFLEVAVAPLPGGYPFPPYVSD